MDVMQCVVARRSVLTLKFSVTDPDNPGVLYDVSRLPILVPGGTNASEFSLTGLSAPRKGRILAVSGRTPSARRFAKSDSRSSDGLANCVLAALQVKLQLSADVGTHA